LAALVTSTAALQQAHQSSVQQLEAARRALQQHEDEGSRTRGEATGELILLRGELESKQQQLAMLQAEKAEILARQLTSDNERLALAAQRDELKLHIEGTYYFALRFFVCVEI
jgi:hypothetical protein